MQIFPFNWELKILFIQLIKHSSDLLIPHKGDGFFCCVWDVCAGTWCSFRARMLSSEIHWELPAQNGILICTARCDLGNPQLCGFCKKRKKLKRAVTFCGHVLCLQSRRVIYPWKILVCSWVGLLLWETWNWALFERLEPAQVGAGGGGSGRDSGGLLRGVSLPCGAVLEGLPGFTTTTVFVLLRNCREPHFSPRMPDTPNTTTNSRGMGTVCCV